MKIISVRSLRAWVLAGAFLALNAGSVRADVEDKTTKSFPVESGGDLLVAVDRGSIEVSASADRQTVDIQVNRKVKGKAPKDSEMLTNHVVTISQTGNKVEVKAEFTGAQPRRWTWNSPQLEVSYRIQIPRNYNVDLATAGGGIKVTSLTGKLQARTSGGALHFEQITGPIGAHTSGGSITVAGSKGPVEVNTSGGSMHLSDIQGDVTAKTAGGAIHAENLVGRTVVRTSGGSISATGIQGSIEANTAGGGISAEIAGAPAGACEFHTSGGGITVALDEKVAVDVDLRTSAGHVGTDLPVVTVVQGEKNKSRLQGKINGGGPLITASTSGGHVELRKR